MEMSTSPEIVNPDIDCGYNTRSVLECLEIFTPNMYFGCNTPGRSLACPETCTSLEIFNAGHILWVEHSRSVLSCPGMCTSVPACLEMYKSGVFYSGQVLGRTL
jgi:hypothetical protein